MGKSIEDLAVILTPSELNDGMMALTEYLFNLNNDLQKKSIIINKASFKSHEMNARQFYVEASQAPEALSLDNEVLDVPMNAIPGVVIVYRQGIHELMELRKDCFQLPFILSGLYLSAARRMSHEFFDGDDEIVSDELEKSTADLIESYYDQSLVYAQSALNNFSRYRSTETNHFVDFYKTNMLINIANAYGEKASFLQAVGDDMDEIEADSLLEQSEDTFKRIFDTCVFMDYDVAATTLDGRGEILQMSGDEDLQHVGLMYRCIAQKKHSSTPTSNYLRNL